MHTVSLIIVALLYVVLRTLYLVSKIIIVSEKRIENCIVKMKENVFMWKVGHFFLMSKVGDFLEQLRVLSY